MGRVIYPTYLLIHRGPALQAFHLEIFGFPKKTETHAGVVFDPDKFWATIGSSVNFFFFILLRIKQSKFLTHLEI